MDYILENNDEPKNNALLDASLSHNMNDQSTILRDTEVFQNETDEIENNHENNEKYNDSLDLEEIDIPLEKIPESEHFQIKPRNDVYYKMYQDAKQKAKIARDLALSSYLEAKRIKNTYMLNDLDESDSDLDDDEFYSKQSEQ